MSAWAANKGKLGLAVAALVIAAGVYWYTRPTRATLSSSIAFVDVSTGKVYDLPRGTVRVPPVENPDTGEATLLPCYVGDDGNWYVADRHRSLVKQMGDVNKTVDVKTLQVQPPS